MIQEEQTQMNNNKMKEKNNKTNDEVKQQKPYRNNSFQLRTIEYSCYYRRY